MIPKRDTDQMTEELMQAYANLLVKLTEIKEQHQKGGDPSKMIPHLTYKAISYWFATSGQIKV